MTDQNTRKSTSYYQEVIAQRIDDPILVTDGHGRIEWVNSAFETLSGYSLAELAGQKPDQILLNRRANKASMARLQRALEKQQPYHAQFLNNKKTGEEYWIDLKIAPVLGADGAVLHIVGFGRDITSERFLYERERDLAAYQEALDRQAIVSVADRSGRITFVNANFCHISGFAAEELIGKTHSVVNSGLHDRAFFEDMWRKIVRGDVWHGEVCNQRKNGEQYWVDTTIVPVVDDQGRAQRYVSIRYDITERKKAEVELRHLAEHDPLTELVNRKILLERLDLSVASGRRMDLPTAGAVLMIDVDHFKEINDTQGHDVGDQVLQIVAKRLLRSTRSVDTVGRLGGDEFAVILPHLTNLSEDDRPISRLHRKLSAPMTIGGREIFPSFSIGVARFPEDGEDAATLLKNGDIALYEAKRNGRNQWQFFDRRIGQALTSRQNLIAQLRRDLDAEKLEVAFQPQLFLGDKALRGVEALVRWNSDGGYVSPAHFIPIAEDCGLIEPLGALVLDKTLRMAAALRDEGLDPGIVSVNVSPRQLKSMAFVDLVNECLDRHAIAKSALELEMTETALVGTWSDKVLQTLEALSSHGVSIALDDFGTGFSSLSHLKDFPVHTLKIDKTFVRDIEIDEQDARLVRAVLSLSEDLGLTTIAEGVEAASQEYFLRENGCVVGQGYLYARPLFFGDLHALLKERSRAARSA